MRRTGLLCLPLICLTALIVGRAQVTAQGNTAPVNDLPNPYRTIEGWAQLGRPWGATSAVDIAPNGRDVWVAERCGANSCASSPLDVVYKFDQNGKLVTSFGAGLFISPHGI